MAGIGRPSRDLRERLVLEEGHLRKLARVLVGEDDADDLSQDAMLTSLIQREDPRALRPWLREVLRNRVRTRARRRRVEADPRLAIVDAEPPASAEISLDRARILAAVERALADLPEPYHSTIVRRFLEDLTPIQIARADGDPPATVRWRIHEGLRRLRARLDERFGSRGDWCGGAVALIGLQNAPSSAQWVVGPGGSSMSHAILLKIAAVIAATVLVATLANGRSTSDADGKTDAESAQWESSVAHARAAEPDDVAGAASESGTPASAGQTQAAANGSEDRPPEHRLAGIYEALDSCVAELPRDALAGLPRLEVDLHIWDIEGERFLETVDITTGRKLLGADGVDEQTPVDAPDVVVHDDLAQCFALRIDLDRVPRSRDGQGRVITHSPGHMHGPRGLVIPLDERGHIDRRQLGDGSERDALRLPDVSDEAVPDPERAVTVLGLPRRGGAAGRSDVLVVECGSYVCGFCKKAERTLEAVRERDTDVGIAWLHLPLGNDAIDLAKAAVAAQRQDRFWDMHRALFEHSKPMARADLLAVAERLGLDTDRFEEDLDDSATELEVARQRQVCSAAGARATPTFFIGGDMVVGELGVQALADRIDEIVQDDPP